MVAGERAEWLPETEADGRALVFEGAVDGRDFLEHVEVVGAKFAQPAEVLDSFLTAAAGEEPAG